MANYKKAENPPPKSSITPKPGTGFWQKFWYRQTHWAVKHRFWQRLAIGLLSGLIIITGSMYGVAQWYIRKNQHLRLEVGATFIADYARGYDLDPKATLQAVFEELGVKQVRLVSYWRVHEHDRGVYNFDELDWQFDMAERYGAKVSLAIGLRQPRWPECHMPDWAAVLPNKEWKQPLYDYIAAVVMRYRDRPALDSYQLENEFFLSEFGICPDFDRERLKYEFDLVKNLDPNTTLIVSRSNNIVPGWPVGQPRADVIGAGIYKRVWDKNVTERYFEHPLPAWYYGFLAGMAKLTTGRDSVIHELQAEPWVDERLGGIKDVPIEEQYKTMSPGRLVSRLEYGRATGMRKMDVWGIEWWYWLKTKQNAPEMWDTAVREFARIRLSNQTRVESRK